MLIDCDTCQVRDVACADCVVTLLLGAPDASADLDENEAAAFSALAAGGLAPPLRLVPVRPDLGPRSTDETGGQRRRHRRAASA